VARARIGSLLFLAVLGFLAAQPVAALQPRPGAENEDCAAAFATPGMRWDGVAMEAMEWVGVRFSLEAVAEHAVTVCVASGPAHLLPVTNRIGCLLVGGPLATVDGDLACGAFQSLRREGEAVVLWQTQVSNAVSQTQPLQWNGEAFERGEPYLE
jgi:hypothetical protein